MRHELSEWGRWWRWRQYAECDQAGVSPGQLLMEICRLGTRVQTTQTTAHHHVAEAIKTPVWVEVMDTIIDELTPAERAAVLAWYVRTQPVGRRSPSLISAEIYVADAMRRDLRTSHVLEACA